MRQYEVTFIVDPVLSGDEIKKTAKTYSEMITKEGGKIVNEENLGLKQLAYPIKKRSSGIYYSIEYQIPNGEIVPKMELSFRRDERIMRFLSVHLDRYGIKYNEDKRNGLIGTKKKDKDEVKPDPSKKPPYKDKPARTRSAAPARSATPPPVEAAAPAVATAPAVTSEPTPVANVSSEEE